MHHANFQCFNAQGRWNFLLAHWPVRRLVLSFKQCGGIVKIVALVIAITFNGNVFVAGQGGDCIAAWINAELPSDWQKIECVEIEID